MVARLTVIKGEGIPNDLQLPLDEPITIGRSKTSNLVLCDISASRSHAEVAPHNDGWTIRDLSMNGTYVGNQRIEGAHSLTDGDIITIADMKIQFIEESSSTSSTKQLRELLLDDFQGLHAFMTTAHAAEDTGAVIQLGLKTIYQHTKVSLCGFLDVNPDNPNPKMIFPAEKEVNATLSRRLTRHVNMTRKTVRLHDTDNMKGTGSVAGLRDALCLPVLTEAGDFSGAFHVYKERGQFTDREFQFCEAVVAFAAQSVGRLRQVHSLTSENSQLRRFRTSTDNMIGESPAMLRVRELIAKVAPTKANVLILGESGVGKEVVAKEIHDQSGRKGLYVPTNCAAIQKDLMESELFGHCVGAFTGATRETVGVIQRADDGTLFLDEVADMALDCQAKLLRALEGHPFPKLGGDQPIKTDTRFLSATNKDLNKAVRDGTFRQDLLFRLNVFSINIPPLRERLDDIPALVEHFLLRETHANAKPKAISKAALERLRDYFWPGNVRELRNVLERAEIVCNGETIEPDDLHLSPPSSNGLPASWHKNDVEAWHIGQVYRMTNGNASKTAEITGLNRETVAKKVKQYNLG